jgi:hypothetical protein
VGIIPPPRESDRTLTGRDFLGLLKDLLPPDALKTLEGK